MTSTGVSRLGVVLACAVGGVGAACGDGAGEAIDAGRDARVEIGPGGCPTNWLPVDPADLGVRARVSAGALVLTTASGAAPVEVRSLIGATPGAGWTLRLEVPTLTLGDGGRLDVTLTAPEGTIATLVVQRAGAVLSVESFPTGSNAELPLATAPTALVFELESRRDLALVGRASFFSAGRGKVLETGVDRFEGGLVTIGLSLAGAGSEVRVDRFARVDRDGGGVVDDFACDTLGLAFDRDAWPAERPPSAGSACADAADCGAGETCAERACRRACLGSDECPGAICLVRDGAGLCRSPAEAGCDGLDAGLVCGPDGTARLGCADAGDCPREADLCVAGACVSNDEDAADSSPWGTCAQGAERCRGDAVEVCDEGGPGWNEAARCGTGKCVIVGSDARCDDCVRSCQGGDVWARCGGSSTAALETACVDGVEACSTGDDNREAAHCRPLVTAAAPTAGVAVPAPTGHIDATEVTRAAYVAFLQSHPDPSAQPAACAWNAAFTPFDYPWFAAPARAVQVDYCDARAYCAFAGKRLCATDAWAAACTGGGAHAWPYGDAFEAGRCSSDTKRDVATSPGCASTAAGWTGVWDLVGGVGEWLDACADGSGATPAADSCRTRGTLPAEGCAAERTVRRDSMAGFRCCGP